MINQILDRLNKNWGLTTEQLQDIQDELETFGNDCYWKGVNDESSEEIFAEYNTGFMYAKKSDMDGYE